MTNETTHQEENIDKKHGRGTKALLAAETRGDMEAFDRLLAYSQHHPTRRWPSRKPWTLPLCAPSILICTWPRKIMAPTGWIPDLVTKVTVTLLACLIATGCAQLDAICVFHRKGTGDFI